MHSLKKYTQACNGRTFDTITDVKNIDSAQMIFL